MGRRGEDINEAKSPIIYWVERHASVYYADHISESLNLFGKLVDMLKN